MFKPVYNLHPETDFETLSLNLNAADVLEGNLDKLVGYSIFENPNAVHLLEKYLDMRKLRSIMMHEIHWFYLALNPNAIHFL